MKWKCWTISKGGELRWLGGRAMALDWRSQSFHKLSEVPFLRTLSLDILSVDHGYMFRYGSLCLRPLDNGRSLWSHGWTTGKANIWWEKNEHFSGQAFRESTGLRARSMCFSTPGFQKTQPTYQGFQLSRSLLQTASSERERVEYLMEEEGKIYAGTHSKPRGRFFQIWIIWCLHKTTTLQTVGVRSILSDGASRSLPSSPNLPLPSPCRESQPC